MKAFRIAIVSSLSVLAALAAQACSPDAVPVEGDDGQNTGRVYTVADDGGQAHYVVIPDAGSAD